MNLIEQLGGYEKAKAGFNSTTADQYGYRFKLQMELLQYRRQHNIFEVGDWCNVWGEIGQIETFYAGGDVELTNDITCDISELKHATDEEIKANYENRV